MSPLLLFHPAGSAFPFSTSPRAHALPHPMSPQGRGDPPSPVGPRLHGGLGSAPGFLPLAKFSVASLPEKKTLGLSSYWS